MNNNINNEFYSCYYFYFTYKQNVIGNIKYININLI